MKNQYLFFLLLLTILFFTSCEEMELKTIHCTAFIVYVDEINDSDEYILDIVSSDLIDNSELSISNQDYNDSYYSDDIEELVIKKNNILFFPFQSMKTINDIYNIEINILLNIKSADSEKNYRTTLTIPELKNMKKNKLNNINFLLRNDSDKNDVLNASFIYELWYSI